MGRAGISSTRNPTANAITAIGTSKQAIWAWKNRCGCASVSTAAAAAGARGNQARANRNTMAINSADIRIAGSRNAVDSRANSGSVTCRPGTAMGCSARVGPVQWQRWKARHERPNNTFMITGWSGALSNQ